MIRLFDSASFRLTPSSHHRILGAAGLDGQFGVRKNMALRSNPAAPATFTTRRGAARRHRGSEDRGCAYAQAKLDDGQAVPFMYLPSCTLETLAANGRDVAGARMTEQCATIQRASAAGDWGEGSGDEIFRTFSC